MKVADSGIFMSWDELKAGLQNVGVDAECGACMEIFFTSMTASGHTHVGTSEGVISTFEELQ